MKTIKAALLIVTALPSMCGTLFAHVVSATTVPHQHPVYQESTATYKLVEENTGDHIEVSWVAKPSCFNPELIQEYTVTIHRSQKSAAIYSLWTLGLQDVNHETVIESSHHKNLRVAETVQGSLRALKPSEVVAPAGWMPLDPSNPTLKVVNDEKIWLMEFVGYSFNFTVKRHGRAGITAWTSSLKGCDEQNGHDNTPPI